MLTGLAAINIENHLTFSSHTENGRKRVVRLWHHLTSYFFQTHPLSGLIFANTEQLLEIANSFPFCSLDFSHMGSTKLFLFPSLNVAWMGIGVLNANWYFINILKYGRQEIIFFIKQLI